VFRVVRSSSGDEYELFEDIYLGLTDGLITDALIRTAGAAGSGVSVSGTASALCSCGRFTQKIVDMVAIVSPSMVTGGGGDGSDVGDELGCASDGIDIPTIPMELTPHGSLSAGTGTNSQQDDGFICSGRRRHMMTIAVKDYSVNLAFVVLPDSGAGATGVNDAEVYMQQELKKSGWQWNCHGGWRETDDASVFHTAAREATEEIGVYDTTWQNLLLVCEWFLKTSTS
jgi:hypothetical protein